MIVFMAKEEGGLVKALHPKPGCRPSIRIKWLRKNGVKRVEIFKNGIIYDGFLPGRTDLRHVRSGGRKEGKIYYAGFQHLINKTKRDKKKK